MKKLADLSPHARAQVEAAYAKSDECMHRRDWVQAWEWRNIAIDFILAAHKLQEAAHATR